MTTMRWNFFNRETFWGRQESGNVSVEMALILPVFLLVVCGIMDFGHAWFMKQVVTTASREGARYGTRYKVDGSGAHILPNAMTPSIIDYVKDNYSNLLPESADLQVTPAGDGYTSGVAGDNLTVTVSATKEWFIMGSLLPSLGSSINVDAATTMGCE